ncbi:MAG: FtsQ-type POTRA domain-containing protein [Bacillota bacterium]|nr:FtsQ-type POTRA domain-containing protein [Bacillota bacterium]
MKKARGTTGAAKSRQSHKRRRRQRRLALVVGMIILLMALISGGIFYLVSTFLNITEVKVTGKSIYTTDQILSVAGIKPGQNMVTVRRTKTAVHIEKELPYIEKAVVRCSLPEKIQIEVQPAKPELIVSDGGVSYIVSTEGKVIDIVEDDTAYNLPKLVCDYGGQPVVADAIAFPDDTTKRIHNTLITALRDNGLLADMKSIDLTNIYSITMQYKDKYKIMFGDYTDTDDKVKFIISIKDKLSENDKGTIDVSNIKKGSFTPTRG